MAVDLDPEAQQHGEEEEDEARLPEGGAPAHHPVAPPDELFDISTTVDPSYIISLIRKLVPASRSDGYTHDGVDYCSHNQISATEPTEERTCFASNDNIKSPPRNQDIDRHGIPVGEEAWEEYGCVLWDLAANCTHAELMVQNLVLEVLLANLMVAQSVRVKEICLGIIGNLACHEVLLKSIVSTNGLVQVIIDQLFLDDTQCLSEACRLLTLCLQGAECVTWAEAMLPDNVIQRLMWIAENTLNPLLLEKCVGLLLVILESEGGAAPILLPPLVEIGLPKLLIGLLSCEMSKLRSERTPERFPVLDVILRVIEALSTMDEHSREISSSGELVQLICNLVKLPDKMEISECCVTCAILLANIMSDVPNLAFDLSQDLPFLQGLFDILPFTSNDVEARNALWSAIARLLNQIKECEMGLSRLGRYASVLASKCDLIEEDLLDQQTDCSDKHNISNSTATAMRRIVGILNHWTNSKDAAAAQDIVTEEEHRANDAAAVRLLELCHKHIE